MKALITLALAAVLLAAGCGDDNTSSSKTPSSQATPSTGGVRPSSPASQPTAPARATPGATSAAPATPAQLSDGNAPGIPSLTGDIKSEGNLRYIDELLGTGDSPKAGQQVTVHYTGWTTDGKKFDSSRDRGQPFVFPLGQGRVIRGWDIGVASMKIGGKRRLIIPADLGYGSRGSPPAIPPNATLIFDVELISAK